ncbi:MAG TPA: glycoside hydrolase family 38 C-terminal domain-containing protein, partial [Pseudomonadales bacterium]|nr:glycoside hydrolase family 38 C-terminal domain-containing protein [Pseudomonadales bacterium]
LYGIGDGGAGPSRTHIEWTRLARDFEDLPKVTMEKASDFFPKAEASSRDLLTWVGELYFEYHRGTYTSQALVKKMNRRLELLAREVEFLYAQLPASQYPARDLDQIWKVILLNQFHDIIPGSSITRVYKEAHEQYVEAERQLIELREAADTAYSRSVDNTDIIDPRIVLNPLSWERETIVFLPNERRILWADASGKRLESQRVAGGVLIQLHAPSMGHNLVGVALGQQATRVPDLPSTEKKLENDFLRVDFAADGRIRRIYDKEHAREVLAPGERANEFCLYEDLPLAYEAWDIDAFYLEKPPTHPKLKSMELVELGALRSTIRQVFEDDNYEIVQLIQLDRDSRLIEFVTEVDWRESQHMLRVQFPVNVKADTANYEIQFGHVSRPTHANTSWDMARFEVVAHKWADLSQPNYGVAILNDCKYGHRIFGNTISLNLLRSPTRPDPEADRHVHRFRYALYPHAGNHVEAEVVNRAYEFNVPARVFKATSRGGKRSPLESFIVSDSANVIIDTVKRAEDDRDVIVRLYEAGGIDAETVIRLSKAFTEVVEVDLMEQPVGEVSAAGQKLRLSFSPFEIKTLKFSGI